MMRIISNVCLKSRNHEDRKVIKKYDLAFYINVRMSSLVNISSSTILELVIHSTRGCGISPDR